MGAVSDSYLVDCALEYGGGRVVEAMASSS